MPEKTGFNLAQFPLEGVAAYWLSLARIAGEKNKTALKLFEEELAYPGDQFIRQLLQLAMTEWPEADLRKLIGIKREAALKDLRIRLDLMRVTLIDMAAQENPRKSLVKVQAQFIVPPLEDEKAASLAQEMYKVATGKKALPDGADRAAFFNVELTQKPDDLLVGLLFYVIYSRREGKQACEAMLPNIHSDFFRTGLSLVIDGFDEPFIRKTMRVHRNRVLEDAGEKMDMCVEMCLAMRAKKPYNYVFELARAWLP